jgi:hypothetical protein
MNEASAREVVLVRAVETRDADRAVWRDEDREWATRAAAEVVGESAPPDWFLARRASLALERLSPRHPTLTRALRAVTWRSWIGAVLALAALALGLASNQLGPAQRVNILAFPLLALLAWNVAVYAVLIVRLLVGWLLHRPRGPVRGLVARLAQRAPAAAGRDKGALGPALTTFFAEWARLSAPLMATRAARVLHWAAALFALGAVGGMYFRGLAFEYRAGWESTFLTAEHVRALLAFALSPGSALTGIAVPDAPHIERIRFGASVEGENAAPWIHLYAATTAAIVLVPRVLLALVAWLLERRWSTHFPLRLEEPYFARLLRTYARGTARVRVLPYSYQVPVASVQGLTAVFSRVLGPHAEVAFAEPVAYGDEFGFGEVAGADLVAALFNLAATPERENQSAFLAALRERVGSQATLTAIVDESGFRRRFSSQPGRIEERHAAWRDAFSGLGIEPIFVDLSDPELARAEASLNAVLDRSAAGPAR